MFWSVFVFLTPFGYTLLLMMVIRALMGMGEGVSLPAIHSILGKWVPKKSSGKPTGFVQAGIPFGMAITMPIATWIILNWSWQLVFFSFAFLAPVWCIIWWKFGRDRPEQYPGITKAELNYIQEDNDNNNPILDKSQQFTNKEILTKGSIWLAAFPYFCANYLFFLFMTWLPTYFVNGRGIDLSQSAFFSMLPHLVAIFTYPLGGFLADKISSKLGQNIGRKIVPIVGLTIAGVFLILATRMTGVGSAAALIALSNGFLTLTMGSFFSMPMVFSQRNTGLITGMFTTLGTVAGILAPIMSGYIIDFSGHYDYALYVGASIAIFGAIVLATVVKVKPLASKKRQEEELAV
jgi:MFS family permease